MNTSCHFKTSEYSALGSSARECHSFPLQVSNQLARMPRRQRPQPPMTDICPSFRKAATKTAMMPKDNLSARHATQKLSKRFAPYAPFLSPPLIQVSPQKLVRLRSTH